MIDIKFDIDNNEAIAYDNEKQVGICEFLERENEWNIVHTEVSELYKGQGIARRLVECVIENAKVNNKKLMADCSYAKKVLENNNG